METKEHLNIFERLNLWIKESITIKLISIGFLVLMLLIPASWIDTLINERQTRADEVIHEVSEKWSGGQTLSGPILVIPYKVFQKIDHGKKGIEIMERTEKYFFLPEMLTVSGEIKPQILHRGIFDAVVYESALTVKADFIKPDFKSLNIAEDKVLWSNAYMIFGVSDLRGISENPNFKVGDSSLLSEPSNDLGISVSNSKSENGIITKLNWLNAGDFSTNTTVKLNLKGSRNLSFVPTGKTTNVNLGGPWANPSFDGEFLPENREVNEKGFTANWKVLHFNRPFEKQWNTYNKNLSGASFGLNLLIPVDQYQKSIRTSKYGQLIIILTFVALFLVEITKRVRIHPFQYILIGAALIIYYTLLLSFSEQFGYNIAYWIATTATVSLISFYAVSFLKNFQLVILLTLLLIIFYAFIFIIIMQQDLSLLLGSIGLFIIIAALMYFSRKVDWYKEATE